MAQVVLGVFSDKNRATEAIGELETQGYNPKDISIVMKDEAAAHEVADSSGANVAGGAVSGATAGGVLGGLAGLLVGIGAITVPGIGALLIGGPLATALGLTGVAATTVSGALTGALAGGLVGALMGWGVPEEEAKVYEERVREGAILVAVPTMGGKGRDAKDILAEYGADNIRILNTR